MRTCVIITTYNRPDALAAVLAGYQAQRDIDLQRVNGLDEAYSGWALNDFDLVIRLMHAGVNHKSARFAAPVFHLWHAENDRSRFPENQRGLDAVLRSDRVRAQIGIDQNA